MSDQAETREHDRQIEALTAIELIRRLIQLDPNTVISVVDNDPDSDSWYVWGIASIDDDGQVSRSAILTSWVGSSPLDPANRVRRTLPQSPR